MTRSIATLTIALLIGAAISLTMGACTEQPPTDAERQKAEQGDAEAQTGMTVETVYLYLTEEEFERKESGSGDDHYHSAIYDVPEITQAAWEQGTVIVHKCFVPESSERLDSSLDQWSMDADPNSQPSGCTPLGKHERYIFMGGALSITHDVDDSGSTARQARRELRLYIATFPLLRVTIIAPAE